MSATKVQVRPAVPADLGAIVALERATDTAPHWPEQTYRAILGEELAGPRCLFVASGDRLAGFAVGVLQPTPAIQSVAELESVAVAAADRRRGIGRALCCAVLDWCRVRGATEVVLEVRASSAGAIALYTGLGFTPAGRRPRYYRDPEDDALLMRLPLGPVGQECG